MRAPDWTTFKAEDGSPPCGPCCLLERTFDLSNLPRNYIWTLGYLGNWPGNPEEAEISAQVKSYSRAWLMERAEVMKRKAEQAAAEKERLRQLQEQRRREDQAIATAEHTDVEAIKRKIEAGPLDMVSGVLKGIGQLATGGVTDPTARMEICNTCPFKGDDQRCGKCGCYLPAKTRIAKSSCPIGLW